MPNRATNRVVVVGAGLAGLVAAIRLARAGRPVTLVTKGLGGLQLGQGTIDLLGYAPDRVTEPLPAIAALADDHPYRVLGAEAVRAGIDYVHGLLPELLDGSVERNLVLPTAVGALRPTCLAQPSMRAGELLGVAPALIAGLRQLKDFPAALCASNLARQAAPDGSPIQARSVVVDFPAQDGMADSSALAYARFLDRPEARERLAAALRPQLREAEVVGLPAVLGVRDRQAHAHLEQLLGHQVFEIPLPPPGVPGIRLNERLTTLAQQAGVRMVLGSRVTGFESSGSQVTAVCAAVAGRLRPYPCSAVVYAPGGLESGAISMDSYGTVSEVVFDLPLAHADSELLTGPSWHDQPLFRVGVRVGPDARAEGPYTNLYAAGGIIAGAIRWTEKSGDGIALASAVRAADSILKGA